MENRSDIKLAGSAVWGVEGVGPGVGRTGGEGSVLGKPLYVTTIAAREGPVEVGQYGCITVQNRPPLVAVGGLDHARRCRTD